MASSPIATAPSTSPLAGSLDVPIPTPREPETVEAFLPRNRSQTLPVLRSRKAAPRQTPSASPSGHRPSVLAMGRLTRTGWSPALMRYTMKTPRIPAPATSTAAAASPLTPSPPIDPYPLQDHTLRRAQLRDRHGETRVMIDTSLPEPPRTPTRRLTIPKAHSLRSSGSVQQVLSAMLPHGG